MCAKPEPTEVFKSLNDLTADLTQFDPMAVRRFAWAGVTVYYGLLENV